MKRFSSWTAALLTGWAALATTMPAHAADPYPTKPVKWVVAYAAGGGTDAIARLVGSQLSSQLGQSVLIDNRPGGATVIASDLVAKSPADGYTIYSADNGTLVFNTALFKKLSYDPQKDFVPVGLLARIPLLLVAGPATPYTNAKDLLAEMRKNPGKLSYASPGTGSPHHLAMEMLKERAKVDAVHIPYKGAAPAIQDVVGGQAPLMVVDIAAGAQMIKAGKLKPLATFSKTRIASLPEVPTLIELGLADVEAVAWQSVVAPAGTPSDVLAKLSAELQTALNNPAVRQQLLTLGVEPTPSDGAAMLQHYRQEMQYWPKLIRDRQISLD
jgi:tripartite-type tricarboxylate transporter receptor subunit TctC